MFSSIKTRVIAAFLTVALIVSAALCGVGYFYIYSNQKQIIDNDGIAAADSCADVFELIHYEEGMIDPSTEDYQNYRKILRDLCRNSDMDYLYAYKCDVEAGTITYLMCVADDDEMDKVVAEERGFGTVVYTDFSKQELRALNGEHVAEPLELNNSYGHTLAWFSRVDGWDGNVLAGADYLVSEQWKRIMTNVALFIVSFLVVLLILLLVQLHILRRYVFDPVKSISGRMKGFSTEHAGEFEPLGIESSDEIGDIASSFEVMADDISSYLKDIERMTTERVQTDVELDVARRIQLGMVPERSDVEVDACSVAASSRPARTVGGDFYDIIERDDGSIAIVVGDVSGKGVASALFMAMAKAMIAEALASGSDPADALNSVNKDLYASNPEGMFSTVFACVLYPTTGEVHYANAGHMPPLIVGPDVSYLDVDPGDVIGLFDDVDLSDGSIILADGQGLVVYTDGVTEAINANRAFYGQQAFLEHMSAGAPYGEAREAVNAVVEGVDAFVGTCEQSDDLTVAVIVRSLSTASPDDVLHEGAKGQIGDGHGGGSANACKQEVPCDISSFSKIREAILATPFVDALKRKMCLACEEAFANIVSYSGADWVRFEVVGEGDSLRVTLEDNGMRFDPISKKKVEKDFEELDSGGMGISLILELASDVTYRYSGDTNVLTIRM